MHAQGIRDSICFALTLSDSLTGSRHQDTCQEGASADSTWQDPEGINCSVQRVALVMLSWPVGQAWKACGGCGSSVKTGKESSQGIRVKVY